MSSSTKPTILEINFEERFNAYVYMSFLGEGFLYSSKKENSNIYELFSYEKDDIDKLMEQSLKEGRDLVFEACKGRPYNEEKAFKDIGLIE